MWRIHSTRGAKLNTHWGLIGTRKGGALISPLTSPALFWVLNLSKPGTRVSSSASLEAGRIIPKQSLWANRWWFLSEVGWIQGQDEGGGRGCDVDLRRQSTETPSYIQQIQIYECIRIEGPLVFKYQVFLINLSKHSLKITVFLNFATEGHSLIDKIGPFLKFSKATRILFMNKKWQILNLWKRYWGGGKDPPILTLLPLFSKSLPLLFSTK